MGSSSLITFKITLENLIIIIILLICKNSLHVIAIKIFDIYAIIAFPLSSDFMLCFLCSCFLLKIFIDFSDRGTQNSSK